ncbi:MAG: PEP-CTERM sorting domain-containing protein [Burkholderiaceae bacterium]|nr:PEP-CTERM sorting domain-containing protein [Burkholderiaceae bacterium]
MRMKQLAAISLAVLGCGSAYAEDDTVDYLGSLNPGLVNQFVNFGTDKSASGLFHDVFNFSFSGVAPPSIGAATGVQIQFNLSTPNVDFSNVALNGVGGTVSNLGVSSFFFTAPVLGAAGPVTYVLEVWGTAEQTAKYGGSLNVATVPEPESYALMLAGLGALGFMARRRKQS